MKKGYLFIILAVIIVIMFSLFNIFKNKEEVKKPESNVAKISLGEEFTLKEGDEAGIEGLLLSYNNTSFPPESYTGDREEFTYAQIEIAENGDTLNFPLNKKLNSKIFHRYEIKLVDMIVDIESRSIKLVISPKEVNAKLLEEEAVEIALKEAEKKELDNPTAINRTLEWGLWIIEVTTTKTDIYLGVEIDANTGEVKRSYTDSRS